MKRSVDQVQGGHEIAKRSRTEAGPSVLKEVRPSAVPKYLGSEFYKSLNIEDDEEFYIPVNYMKENLRVDTLQDACDLLHTVRYWGSDVSLLPVAKFAPQKPFAEIRSTLRAFENEVPLIQSLLYILDSGHSSECRMEKAMGLGIVELVANLHQRKAKFSVNAIATAAASGYLDCLHYALQHQNSWKHATNPEKLYEGAVASGQIASIICLNEKSQYCLKPSDEPRNQPHWRHLLPCIAAEHNQLFCLQYLRENGCDISDSAVSAAKGGSLACLKHIVERRSPAHQQGSRDAGACIAAAQSDSLNCLKYLHQKGNELTVEVCVQAAKVGSLSCLKYFYENGGVWHSSVCHAAALNGHLQCLRYVLEHGCPSAESSHVVLEVATRQHWECVQCLIMYNCPSPAPLITELAYNNQHDLAKLAMQHGCKTEVEVAVYYAETGNLPYLKLVMEHGCERLAEILVAAAAHGQLQCMVYAHEQGCVWSSRVCVMAARGGHLQCLMYAREHGCPWDGRVLFAARDFGHRGIVKYAMEHNCPEIVKPSESESDVVC